MAELFQFSNHISREPGFGIYIHWPFCASKCPYCDFNSHVRHGGVDQPKYVKAYRAEIARMRELTGPKKVTSIFFGGGTPSLMTPETVGALLDCVFEHWQVDEKAEITLEANPSSVEADRFKGYKAAGVNRVSLGVQALNDTDLKLLGRLHTAKEALSAVALARDIFPRLSFDLIYARPNQTLEEWRNELKKALHYSADHLSLYQLTIEEGTPFYALHKAGKLIVPDGEFSADLYEETASITSQSGYDAYEVSNYAVPGGESRHNLTYWRYGDYVGVGPGAHGRIRIDGQKTATICEPMPEAWLENVNKNGWGVCETEMLSSEVQSDEYLLMGLRLKEGIEVSKWSQLSGRELDPDKEDFLIGIGMVERIGNNRIRCTPKGMLILDAVVADLAS